MATFAAPSPVLVEGITKMQENLTLILQWTKSLEFSI